MVTTVLVLVGTAGLVASAAATRASAAVLSSRTDPGDANCPYTPPPLTSTERLSAEKLSLDKLAELLRDGAIDYAESEGIGWVVNLIGGGHSDGRDNAQVEDEIRQANDKIDGLYTKIDGLCQEIKRDAATLEGNQYWSDYQQSLSAVTAPLASIETDTRELEVIEHRPVSDPSKPASTGLTDQDKRDILTIRDNVREDTSQLGQALLPPASSGKVGVIASYARVLDWQMTHPTDGTASVLPPNVSKLYTTEFVTPMSNLVEYYTGIMLGVLDTLADVFHADFDYLGGHYRPDDSAVKSFTAEGLQYIDSWNLTATRGVQRIPDNTVVDVANDDGPYTMWTQTPVDVADYDKQAYCYDVVAFCWDNDYDQAGDILSASLVGHSNEPVTALISRADYGGYPDWHVPSVADFAALTSSETGGLGAWAAARGLEMFKPTTITDHFGGTDKHIRMIGPFLTTRRGHPGSLSSDDPDADGLSFHAPREDGQNEVGGALLLARTATVATFCTGWCAQQPTARKVAAGQPDGTPGMTSGQAAPVGRVPARQSGGGSAPLNQPVTYTKATTCSSGPVFTVPRGAAAVRITVAGGAGGDGKLEGSTAGQPGGHGGTATALFQAVGGEVLHVQVGDAGSDTSGGVGGGGNGGATVPGPGYQAPNHSGGGGGASGVATDAACDMWLAVGGGGGGGGSGYADSHNADSGGTGGDACPLPNVAPSLDCARAGTGRDNRHVDPDSGGGGVGGGNPPNNAGGTNNQVGGLVGQSGANLTGGRGSDGARNQGEGYGGAGGGGGAGYFGGGGGGGGGNGAAGGGGGGGASYVVPEDLTYGTTYGLSDSRHGSVTITAIGEQGLSSHPTSAGKGYCRAAWRSSSEGCTFGWWRRARVGGLTGSEFGILDADLARLGSPPH